MSELDRIETSTEKFFEDVRQGYLQLVKTEPRFFYIDATMPIEQIHEIILHKVLEVEKQHEK